MFPGLTLNSLHLVWIEDSLSLSTIILTEPDSFGKQRVFVKHCFVALWGAEEVKSSRLNGLRVQSDTRAAYWSLSPTESPLSSDWIGLDLWGMMCLFISVMLSQPVLGISQTPVQYILGTRSGPRAAWRGLEKNKCAPIARVWSEISKSDIKFIELLLCQASKQSSPSLLLEAARKDREGTKIGHRYNSNCHQENASQTERDQIEGGHYHFY